MLVKTAGLISLAVFLAVIVILGLLLKTSWVLSILMGLFGAGISYLILTKSKNNRTRLIVFCAWGIIFAVTIFIGNIINPSYFICPSKIPLVGENAGLVPLILNSNESKGLLPCPFGIFQNYGTSFITSGFLMSIVVLSLKLFGAVFIIWLVLAFVLGRSWCGWICPFGGFIETISRIRRKPVWKFDFHKYKYFRYGFLGAILLVILAAKYAPAYDWCIVCPMKGIYHSPTYFADIFKVPSEFITYILFISFFLVLPFLTGKRVWCAVMCPLGALTSVVGSYSLLVTRINQDDCVNCNKCVNACKLYAVSRNENDMKINNLSCSNCGECATKCPKEAIKYYIRGTDIEVSKVFIPVVVTAAITIAVILVTVMWKPIYDLFL
jgi:Polyferredoxin